MFELENIYLTCSALVYSFFLQITRSSFIKVFPFKYAFAKGAGENWKELLPELFLSYQKRISLMDVFLILQISANDFRVGAKGKQQQHYKKLK